MDQTSSNSACSKVIIDGNYYDKVACIAVCWYGFHLKAYSIVPKRYYTLLTLRSETISSSNVAVDQQMAFDSQIGRINARGV